MLDRLIDGALHQRVIVVLGIILLLVVGMYQYLHLPIDAFPDISPIMVPVFAEAHGMAPEEIERLITFPIESAMNGLPSVTMVKSTSAFGLAVVYVYFSDDTDIYFARQIVAERLSGAMADLPDLHEPPMLGPISTGLGQIFMYYLTCDEDADTDGKERLTWLREINDWIIKFHLQTVPGVTDILSIGGHVLQYQLIVNPLALHQFGISLDEVVAAVRNNNRNAGGQFLVLGSEEYLVRGLGLVQTLEQLGSIQIKVVEGVPITLSDIADVRYGQEIRRGVTTRNGEQEVVSGIVLQLFGENTSRVIEQLMQKIPDVQRSLPRGVTIVPYYEQAELVHKATDTVKIALLQGSGLVLLVLLVFLGNVTTAGIVALALPLCVLFAVVCMGQVGVSANLMSLGGIAIAIGMLADGSIVMVENIFRYLSLPECSMQSRRRIVMQAAREVTRPIFFSVAIIIVVFLPLFTLQGVEGKMFTPMAFSISFALVGSLLAALLVAPVLSSLLLRQCLPREFFVLRFLKALYGPALRVAIRGRSVLAVAAVILVALSLMLVPRLGVEFVPTLEEGSMLIGVNMAPSISLDKATETIMAIERHLVKFPEVTQTVSRIGRPETGSHPHPVNYAEIHCELTPFDRWPPEMTRNRLIERMIEEIGDFPGVQLNFTQPIQNAFDELLSGIKGQLAIKLFGDDLTRLRDLAQEIKTEIESVPGLVDLSVEQSFGQPQVQIIADRDACSRYNVTVSDILNLVEQAIGGEVIDHVFVNTRRFGIHLRYGEAFRDDPQAIERLLVQRAGGELVPLSQVADVTRIIGPIQINRENNQRRWIIQANVRNRDLGSVVADIQERISLITLPAGYYIEYGGQFENQQRAMTRLTLIVPLAILLIFTMLYITFHSFRHALLIMLNVPLALIGGVLGLILTGEYLSVPAAIGFIALFGIAVQNGVVLVLCIKQLREEQLPLVEAIVHGSMRRLRPVLMTALTTMLGLVPLLLSSGIGSEIQRPLATVVVYGLGSSTLLTLFLLPALYGWFEGPAPTPTEPGDQHIP